MDFKLFAYKRNVDISNECRVCSTQEEADALQAQGWHISPVEIAWTGENAKMFADNGDIIDRPKPELPKQYAPTPEEIKQQNMNNLNMIYPVKLSKLLNAKSIAEMNGLPTTAIAAKYKAVNAEWKAKIQEITK